MSSELLGSEEGSMLLPVPETRWIVTGTLRMKRTSSGPEGLFGTEGDGRRVARRALVGVACRGTRGRGFRPDRRYWQCNP